MNLARRSAALSYMPMVSVGFRSQRIWGFFAFFQSSSIFRAMWRRALPSVESSRYLPFWVNSLVFSSFSRRWMDWVRADWVIKIFSATLVRLRVLATRVKRRNSSIINFNNIS